MRKIAHTDAMEVCVVNYNLLLYFVLYLVRMRCIMQFH